MNTKIREQIIKIAESGRTNMFLTNKVQVIADELGFYELVIFLEEYKKEYVNFIMYGDERESM